MYMHLYSYLLCILTFFRNTDDLWNRWRRYKPSIHSLLQFLLTHEHLNDDRHLVTVAGGLESIISGTRSLGSNQ